MDCTQQCSIQSKQNSKHYVEDNNELYYSFNNDIQFPDSLTNEFDVLKYQINSNLFQETSKTKDKSIQKSSESREKAKQKKSMYQLIDDPQSIGIYGKSDSKQKQYNQKHTRGVTRYESLQKDVKQFSPSSPNSLNNNNKISLLGSSLELQKRNKKDQPNKLLQSLMLKSQSTDKDYNSKNFPPSVQVTSISDKFKVKTLTIEPDRKGSSQENSSPNRKKYRIQNPDEVYNQLQVQIQKQKKINPNQVVRQNINNVKAMLEKKQIQAQQPKQVNYLSVIQKNKNPQTNQAIVLQLVPSQKFQNISSTCLARLPSPSIYETIKQYYTNEYYHKYSYVLNQQELLIDNCYHIKYRDITKIKIIYNQFNRPQIKLTYSTFEYSQVDNSKSSKDVKSARNRINTRHSFCVSEQEIKKSGQELVLFLCQCYQSMYTIFSCVIIRKLFSINKQKNKNINMLKDKTKQSKKSKSSNLNISINLNDVGVNTNLINFHPNNKKQEIVTFDYPIEGVILKKSRHLKKWERRYVKIQNFYLRSFRIVSLSSKQKSNQSRPTTSETSSVNSSMANSKSYKYQSSSVSSNSNLQNNSDNIPVFLPLTPNEKISSQCTFQIQNIKQLWTRFQVIQQKYLIIKIFKKNKLEKIQMAIPINNYCDVLVKDNWLFALIGLLKGEI